MLAFLLAGWRSMTIIARGSRPISVSGKAGPFQILPGWTRAWESELLETPITVGVVSPKIILPPT